MNGPEPLDMLRAFTQIRRDPLNFLRGCAERYGDVVEFPIPGRQVFFANHPDAVQQILQSEHRTHDRATVQYRTLSLVTGNGLLTSDGELWRRQRRLMQPAFHREVLSNFVGHIDIAVDRLLASWSRQADGDVVDVDDAMMRTALEVVGRSLFSHDLSGEARELVDAVLKALDVVVARARSPLAAPLGWPTPGNMALKRSLRTLDRTVEVMVEARRQAQRRGGGPEVPDLLGMLLASEGFDDRQLRDEIVTLIVAGHETVASALTWTWHLLGQNPDALAKLHAEVDDVLGGARPTFEDLPRLTYTRQVIDESLRLYPPAWVVSRRATADGDILGTPVPAGSYTFISPYVLHRTAAYWPDPDRFDPDRFDPDRSDPDRSDPDRLVPERKAESSRFAYVPFGAGPNLCIGRDLAVMESVMLVASVASKWSLEPLVGREVRVDPLVTIRPHGGLPMALKRRSG